MGFNFFRIFRPKNGPVSHQEIACTELVQAGIEFQIRNLCFAVCVNMIANAIGRCEVRTFRNDEEIQEQEYYLWNVDPNTNQNSTAFWHKFVTRLVEDNEVLVIQTRRRDGREAVVVADDWTDGEDYPNKQHEYKNVQVGDMTYDKTFREQDVLHLTLNHGNAREVIDGMYQSYVRLVTAAMKHYEWNHGQHWKVHVNQMAQGQEGWAEAFQKMLQDQVKPFFESNGAILPEFDGYTYTNESGSGSGDTRDIRAMVDDIFAFTARGLQIPAVLIDGQVSGAENAVARFLGGCIDPICDQFQEEATRKRYGYAEWKAGSYLRMDSSAIQHFDLFANAPNVEKLVGSGAFTINDILRAANQPTINEPWADEHFLTKNIAALQEAAISLDAQKGGRYEQTLQEILRHSTVRTNRRPVHLR